MAYFLLEAEGQPGKMVAANIAVAMEREHICLTEEHHLVEHYMEKPHEEWLVVRWDG